MTPDARISAAIELLSEISAAAEHGGPASDTLVRRYFASRRFAGSGDRRFVTTLVYDVLRDWQALAWRVKHAGAAVSPRTLVIARLVAQGEDPVPLFTGAGFGPEGLNDDEQTLIGSLEGDAPSPPSHALANCPAWLEESLRSQFGERFDDELAALNERAPLDLRVNTLRTTREAAQASLLGQGFEVRPTPIAPFGLRLDEPRDVSRTREMKSGEVEVQDEGAQIACRLVDARAGMQVVDLCAGAGGKTLALAASMENTGQIHAFDNANKRLEELKKRGQRAAVRNVQVHRLPTFGEKRDRILSRFAGTADRVVVDVPCSGSGTWRRNPELRLRLTPERLTELMELQRWLLDEGAALAKPGARLIYITCSILPQENGEQIEGFLADNAGWRRLSTAESTSKELGEILTDNDYGLQLSPASHGTDGFFVSVLARPAGS